MNDPLGGGPPPDPGAGHHELTAMVLRLTGDLAAVSTRVATTEERVEDLAGALDDIEGALATVVAAAVTPGAVGDPSQPVRPGDSAGPDTGAAADHAAQDDGPGGLDMRRLVAWVRDNVASLLERKVPQTGGYPYWCRRWWLHPEAIARFEAARRSWTGAVVSPDDSMVVYFEHLDHQLGVLCGENGPFCGCTGGEHRPISNARPLGQDEPDEAYFVELEQAAADAPTR